MSLPKRKKKPDKENAHEPNVGYKPEINEASEKQPHRETELKDSPIYPFNPQAEDTQMFGKKKNDDAPTIPWFIKTILGLIGGGFALYILVSLHLIDINNICIINFGSCGPAITPITDHPISTLTPPEPPTLDPGTPNPVPPTDCTLPGAWKLENQVFTMNISKVVISNVGGDRNMLMMTAQVTNRSDYYINLPLQANMRFLHTGHPPYGPSVAMSAWPGSLDPNKSDNWQIVIDQTPSDIGLLDLEFLGMSINHKFMMLDDEQLKSLGITSLSIQGIPGSC